MHFPLFPAVKYTEHSLVYKEIISKTLHHRPMLAWTAHEETLIWRRLTQLNTTQLQHFCELSDCSACTSFSFISTTVPYLDKGSSCICISQEHNQALLLDTQLKTFSLAPPTLHSKWQLRFISCLRLANELQASFKRALVSVVLDSAGIWTQMCFTPMNYHAH